MSAHVLHLALLAPAAALQDGVAVDSSWDPGAVRWVHLLGEIAGWALPALALLLVLKALLRRERYRAVSVLDDAAREKVRAAVFAAEATTAGEIVPVVVERSDPHPAAEWKAALVALLLGSTLLAAWLPWEQPALLLGAQLALGAVGWGLARALPDLKRHFLFETRATQVAEEQALQEFARHGLRRTAGGTGVLLFVSLFERRVVVLADATVSAKAPADTWDRIDALVLDGVVAGDLAGGLCRAVAACGEVLAEHFPRAPDDDNELPDTLIVRRE